MTNINKTLNKVIIFEEKTKQAKKSSTIIIDSVNKDIPVNIVTKRSL